MRSRQGVLAALAFLVALPSALLLQVVLDGGAETTIHVIFAAGSVLLAGAVLDFDTPAMGEMARQRSGHRVGSDLLPPSHRSRVAGHVDFTLRLRRIGPMA